MKRDTFGDQQVVEKVQASYTAIKLDGRKHADIAKQLRVKLYPTTVIVHPSGTVVEIITGYLGPQEFLKRLASAEQKLDYHSKLLALRSSRSTKQ